MFLLGALVTGFLAGIGTYQGILTISDRTTIAKDTLQSLQARAAVPTHEQRWLRIRGIEGLEGFNARIIAHVNGMAYSYPSRAVWSHVGPGMSSEDFPLPAGENEYRVSFEILSRSNEAKFNQFQSQEVIRVCNWPFDSSYKIFAITQENWGTVRGIPPGDARHRQSESRIHFEIR